jgi:cation diffusion facilitator CzcD-associated flavoprotein CzcO
MMWPKGVDQYVKFNHKVVGARWEEAHGQWHVDIERPDGSKTSEEYDVIVNASGILK